MATLEPDSIGLKGITVVYDAESDQYEIDLQNVSLIALDSRTKIIRIKIKSDQIKLHPSQALLPYADVNNNALDANKLPEKTWKDELLEKIQDIEEDINVKETEKDEVQKEIHCAVSDEDYETAAKLSQDKKRIISEVNELKRKVETLQNEIQTHDDTEPQKQHSFKDEIEDKLRNINNEIAAKQTEKNQIQNDIIQAIEDDDFEKAAIVAPNKKKLIAEINELELKANALQSLLDDDKNDNDADNDTNDDHKDKDDNQSNEAQEIDANIASTKEEQLPSELEDAGAIISSTDITNNETQKEQTEEDDETETESATPIHKIKATQISAPITPITNNKEDKISQEDDSSITTPIATVAPDVDSQKPSDTEFAVETTPVMNMDEDIANIQQMNIETVAETTITDKVEVDEDMKKDNEVMQEKDAITDKEEAIEIIEKEDAKEVITNTTTNENQTTEENEWNLVFNEQKTQKQENMDINIDMKEEAPDIVSKKEVESKQDTEASIKQDTKDNDANSKQGSDEDSKERSPSSESLTIDMAMNEIILKNAQKKSNEDDDKQNDKTPKSRSRSYYSSDASTANEYQFKVDWKIAFTPHNIKKEWIALIPRSNDASSEHFACNGAIGNCPCMERLIFVMNHYMLWLKYKLSLSKSKRYLNRGYPKTMSMFLSLLINYNKVRLMNDYFHVKRYHMNHRGFLEYFKQKLVTTQCLSLKSAHKVCLQWDRNNGNKEIYRLYSSEKRRQLYLITAESNLRELSAYEMNEIQLQQFLDMIHSTFIHKAISDGKKFANKVYNLQKANNGKKTVDESSSPDTDTTVEDKEEDDEQIVDAPNYAFGILFNYWDKNKSNYVAPKYGNLKRELLNNMYYKIDKNDYNLLWYKAKDFVTSNEGRYCISKRIISERYSKINKFGKEIPMDHVIALLIYCNYFDIQNKLKRGCRRMRKRESLDKIKTRHSEIVNWCKLIHEIIYCFGDCLTDSNLYHMINVRLTFNILQIQFHLPSSTTSKYAIAKSLNKNKGICLKLSPTYGVSKELNCFFDVSCISDFPNECECIVFGDKFNIDDVLIHGVSTYPQLNVLKLYYQIIRGRWYTHNKNQFKKKNQREIIKMINCMINHKEDKENEDGIDAYVQATFETMTRNLLKNTIWVNRNGFEQLLPELKQLFFDEFVDYLQKNYNIKTKYGDVVILKISKEDVMKSSRDKPIHSVECKHPVNIVNGKNIRDLIFMFRCYKKYDAVAKDMVLKGEFVIKPFSNRIKSIRISGGIWFPQIYVDKWDFCTFSHNKLAKGAALFPIKKLDKIHDELIVKICFQIKEIAPAKV